MGPQHRSQNTVVLVIGTPIRVPPMLGNSHMKMKFERSMHTKQTPTWGIDLGLVISGPLAEVWVQVSLRL